MPEICEKVVEQDIKNQKVEVEIDGMKERVYEIQDHSNNDRELLRKTFKQAQEQDKIIKDMLAKTKDILEFRDNFMRFEQEMNDSIIDLFKKVKALQQNQQQGQSDIKKTIGQQDKRLLILERDQTILK